jgi:hypothetical protein
MPSIYSLAAKYSLSGALIERCGRGKRLNELSFKEKRMQCCAQHREIELEASLAAQKTDSLFFLTILDEILRFHSLGYGLLSK